MRTRLFRGSRPLDGELRDEAPQADEAFVRSLAREIGVQHPAHRRSRLVFVAATTTMVLGSLASFGGVGYAAEGASVAKTTIVSKKSAQGQYPAAKPIVKGVAITKASKPKPPPAQTVTSGTLPFTGLSLVGTLALGGALVGVGIALRRRESRE